MANEKISNALSDLFTKLPNSLNGNGQNFIFLLKKSLGTIADELNEKFEYISKIANAVTDTPDTTNEQVKNCKVQEVRVGTTISLILTWDYSDIKNYESCEIYIKEKKNDGNEVINWDDVAVSREVRTTKTSTYTLDGINAGYTYQIRFQGKNNLGTVSEPSKNPTLIYSVSALNNVPDPPTDFSVYFNRDGVLWTWRQSKNLDYIYSELRTDTNVGNTVGLLEVTQDTKSTKMPPVREGTAYLYNKGYGSKYSTPVTVNWSKPVPSAPQEITAISTYQGLQFSYSEIPEDCIGICISINGNKHYSQDDTFNFYCSTGLYTYKACYYDCFGEGTWSNEQTIGTVEEIPPDAVHITDQTVFDDGVIVGKYIGDHEVVGTKIKEGTITTENIAANAITSGLIATNAVTADKIEADAVTADKIATGAVTADSIGANAVTADKLTSGAVTADKLAANTINLAGALKIVGGNVTLDETGLTVSSTDGKTLFNGTGMVFTDSTGVSYNIVTRSIMGTAKNGQYVKFGSRWPTTPNVIVSPLSMVISNTDFSTSTITLHSYADQITQDGFYVRCYSGIKDGQGVASYNRNYYNGEVSVNKNHHSSSHVNVITNPVSSTSFTAPTNGDRMTVRCRINVSADWFDGTFTPTIKTNIYVNGSLASSATHDGKTISAGGIGDIYHPDGSMPGDLYGAASSSVEFTQTVSFTANATIKVESTYASGVHTVPWGTEGDLRNMKVKISCDLVSAAVNVTGEQVLDANGTALFLVTDNASRNYTVS